MNIFDRTDAELGDLEEIVPERGSINRPADGYGKEGKNTGPEESEIPEEKTLEVKKLHKCLILAACQEDGLPSRPCTSGSFHLPVRRESYI